MATYVYETATGRLESWNQGDNDPVAPADVLEAKGLTAVSGLPELDPTHGWDEATKSVVSVTPPVPARMLGTGNYIMRFTSAEFAAIVASTDPDVMHMMFALNHTVQVDLNDPLVVAGANLLAFKGLIAADRVAAVLA